MTLDLALTTGDLPPDHWRFEAACAGTDDRPFFPTRGSSTKKARLFCWGDDEDRPECPVRISCLNHAIENRGNAGIWGGMSVRERRAEAKRRGENFPQRELPNVDEELKSLIENDIRIAESLLIRGAVPRMPSK